MAVTFGDLLRFYFFTEAIVSKEKWPQKHPRNQCDRP